MFSNTKLKCLRNQAARNFNEFSFIKKQISQDLLARLDHLKGDFSLALDLMCHTGELSSLLLAHPKVKQVVATDISVNMVHHINNKNIIKLVSNPQQRCFHNNIFGLITSSMNLHNINQLPLVFDNLLNYLKPGGLLMVSIPCYGTLSELSNAIYSTDLELYNAVYNRIHPFVDLKSLANMIHAAGFVSVIADLETYTIQYQNIGSIYKDLKGMAEINVTHPRSNAPFSFIYLYNLQNKLKKNQPAIDLTLNICNIIAWKP